MLYVVIWACVSLPAGAGRRFQCSLFIDAADAELSINVCLKQVAGMSGDPAQNTCVSAPGLTLEAASGQFENRLDGKTLGRVVKGLIDLIEIVKLHQLVKGEHAGLVVFHQFGNEDARH